jgi:hypothetical protein
LVSIDGSLEYVSMKKTTLAAAVLVAGLALPATGSMAVPLPSAPAAPIVKQTDGMVEQIQWRRRGGWSRGGGWGRGVGFGIGAGIIGGAILGGALAAPYYDRPYYYYPRSTYAAYPRGTYYGTYNGDGDAIAYCSSRFRSYDPASGTYLGYDGLRHPCP